VRREKGIDAKDADTLFEMKEYDYFCYVLTDEKRMLYNAQWEAWVAVAET